MQSGMIFLFPHILKVVYSAETCKTLDFDSRINMWFNPAMPQTQLRFPCTVDPDGAAPTLWEMYYKIFWPTIIWYVVPVQNPVFAGCATLSFTKPHRQ